jgi:hypothetical protein
MLLKSSNKINRSNHSAQKYLANDFFVMVAFGTKRLDLVANRADDRLESLQLCVLRVGLLEDGDVGVGIFPESEESGVGGAGFGWVTCEDVGAG